MAMEVQDCYLVQVVEAVEMVHLDLAEEMEMDAQDWDGVENCQMETLMEV